MLQSLQAHMNVSSLLVMAVFVAVFSAMMGWVMFRSAKRMRKDHLRIRLGAPSESEEVLQEDVQLQEGAVARLLAESGLGWTPDVFYGWSMTAALMGAVVGTLLINAGVGFLLGVVGAAVFPIRAIVAREKRFEKCNAQMNQAMQLMVLSLRAGHAIPGAIKLAARELPLPLREEFQRATDELDLGRTPGEVMERMAARLHTCRSLQSLSVAIIVLEQTGGNLIHVLERMVESDQARQNFDAKVRAMLAEHKWGGVVMMAIVPLTMLAISAFNRSYWPTMLGSTAGLGLLFFVVVSWGMGSLWIRMLLKQSARW